MQINVYNYELKGWEDLVTGIVLAENDSWVLLHEIPADYRPDGYCLLNKAQLVDYFKDEDSDLKERVLQLQGYQIEVPKGFQLTNTDDMLRFIESHFQLFGVQDEEESIQIGTIQSIVANELRMNYINSYGEVDDSTAPPIFVDAIQSITFKSDYLQAVYLLWKNPV